MIMLALQRYLWSRLNDCGDLDVGGLSCDCLWLLDTMLALYIIIYLFFLLVLSETVYMYIVWNFCFASFEGDKCPSELKLACILEQAVRLALSCCCSVFIISSTRLLADGCIITSIRGKNNLWIMIFMAENWCQVERLDTCKFAFHLFENISLFFCSRSSPPDPPRIQCAGWEKRSRLFFFFSPEDKPWDSSWWCSFLLDT